MKIDEAEFHAHRLDRAGRRQGRGGTPSGRMRGAGQARADMGAACRLAKEAADILASASGGSSIYTDLPIQRIARDLHAINMHALMHPDTNAELYGRILCGLSPTRSTSDRTQAHARAGIPPRHGRSAVSPAGSAGRRAAHGPKTACRHVSGPPQCLALRRDCRGPHLHGPAHPYRDVRVHQ